ncbi:hypothetical protein B0H67DRAFT_74691 [Lasiosphaeris hirsuta]|uniref:Uncharacterized protein n=1 Tax=Lasiosphaeris hirsuta TaxID=260670 RepID=A0AA40BC73_9PEZI|nr:hypothetical protein B0H67DRAFT_74691 [Lasiosphaeris hirsuta]
MAWRKRSTIVSLRNAYHLGSFCLNGFCLLFLATPVLACRDYRGFSSSAVLIAKIVGVRARRHGGSSQRAAADGCVA